MNNSQLSKLLARTPLNEEDKHNVTIIFSSLSDERKMHILNHWELYLAQLIAEQQRLNEEQKILLIETLSQANTILDETLAQQQEQFIQKCQQQEKTRKELA